MMNNQCENINAENRHECTDLYNCCDCGGHHCGCRYCFSCNACDHCLNGDDED
ncbi:hypothetical protein K6U44_04060 [Vibrio parahaemolyticus]|uniref:hypothetical protein n=1 Tax=Vibrio parahaemolyticus TaxID=670 RepID=UPI001EE9DF37|nr:hypothetical protein [Vibrio parahaemolyticus]MCG6459633.1 hypothetical protein [Vibrio parahaemolyticus]